MRKLILVPFIALFLALVGGVVTASSASAAVPAPGQAYTTLKVYNAGGGDTNPGTKNAIKQWNKLHNVALLEVNTPCSGPLCVIVDMVDSQPHCVTQLGGCEWSDENMTIHVEVTRDTLVYYRSEAVRAVILHEMGHALGLDHRDPAVDPDTCMVSYFNLGGLILKPSRQDLAIADELWSDGYEAPAA